MCVCGEIYLNCHQEIEGISHRQEKISLIQNEKTKQKIKPQNKHSHVQALF